MVYPNPSAESFKVDFKLVNDGEVTVRVIDLSGRVLIDVKEANRSAIVELGNDLATGFYFVEITQGEYREIIKIEKIQ